MRPWNGQAQSSVIASSRRILVRSFARFENPRWTPHCVDTSGLKPTGPSDRHMFIIKWAHERLGYAMPSRKQKVNWGPYISPWKLTDFHKSEFRFLRKTNWVQICLRNAVQNFILLWKDSGFPWTMSLQPLLGHWNPQFSLVIWAEGRIRLFRRWWTAAVSVLVVKALVFGHFQPDGLIDLI